MTSVVICTYNRASSLPGTLHSLAKMKVPAGLPWELIVVDNNSADRTPEVVREFAATVSFPVRYVFEGRQGLSHARNAGIGSAAGDIIIFTDDDITVHESWLPEIVKAFAETQCLAAGGKVEPVWSGARPSWFFDQGPYNLSGAIVHFDLGDRRIPANETPFGANMAFRKSAFEKFGMFRTDLGRNKDVLMSGEETEMFRRLMRAGEYVLYTPAAVVYHPVDPERMQRSYFQRWYFQFGKAQVRVEGIPEQIVQVYGVPRYLLRTLLTHAVKWMVAADTPRRFYHKIQVFRVAGMIAESRERSDARGKRLSGSKIVEES